MKGAGIDVGSNNIRFLAAEIEGGRVRRVLAEDSEITRLGANIAATGELSGEGIVKSLSVLPRFKRKLDELGIRRIKAVATSAIRESSNGACFAEEVIKLGIPLEIISADEEARYTALGVLSALDTPPGDMLIYDIGGGSTEFIAVREGRVDFTASVDVGVVKLADKFGFNKPVSEEGLVACENYVSELLSPVFSKFPQGSVLCGTAGAVTTAAAMSLGLENYNARLVSEYILTKGDLERLISIAAPLTSEGRLELRGLQKGREDLIIAGLILIKTILTGFGCADSLVSDYGLREGLAIDSVS